jgi:hypothetical protein
MRTARRYCSRSRAWAARAMHHSHSASVTMMCPLGSGGCLCRLQPALRATRKGGPIIEAACWAHGRRKFFDLARLQKAPIAIEAVERIDALFAIEHEINGLAPEQRLAVRGERSRPLVVELETWLRQQHAKLSRRSETAKAIDYSLKRWTALTRFLDDGRLCMSNNAAERAVRVAMTDSFCTSSSSAWKH